MSEWLGCGLLVVWVLAVSVVLTGVVARVRELGHLVICDACRARVKDWNERFHIDVVAVSHRIGRKH